MLRYCVGERVFVYCVGVHVFVYFAGERMFVNCDEHMCQCTALEYMC